MIYKLYKLIQHEIIVRLLVCWCFTTSVISFQTKVESSKVTEQQELEFPQGVLLIPAEVPLDLVVDPSSLFGLRAEAAGSQ